MLTKRRSCYEKSKLEEFNEDLFLRRQRNSGLPIGNDFSLFFYNFSILIFCFILARSRYQQRPGNSLRRSSISQQLQRLYLHWSIDCQDIPRNRKPQLPSSNLVSFAVLAMWFERRFQFPVSYRQ